MQRLLNENVLTLKQNTLASSLCFFIAFTCGVTVFFPHNWFQHIVGSSIIIRTFGIIIAAIGFYLMRPQKYFIENSVAFSKEYELNYTISIAAIGVFVFSTVLLYFSFSEGRVSSQTKEMLKNTSILLYASFIMILIYLNIKHRKIIRLYGKKIN